MRRTKKAPQKSRQVGEAEHKTGRRKWNSYTKTLQRLGCAVV